MSSAPYSRDELKSAFDGRWPERGERCHRCGVFVPQFDELSEQDRVRILRLAVEGRTMLAQKELMAATGAPPRFAKIWVVHEAEPRPRFPGPPCPHCGKPLASSRARQCLHCHRAWHNDPAGLVHATSGLGRGDMMIPMLEACPSFAPQWDAFQREWSADADKPLYLALGELARHLIAMLEAGNATGLSRAFAVVERWHVEGDPYVMEAATVGLLEDLQNTNLHRSTSPRQFEPFLLPESLKWWREVEQFWDGDSIGAR